MSKFLPPSPLVDACFLDGWNLNAGRLTVLARTFEYALREIARCDDGDNPHYIEDDDHNPFAIARKALKENNG